MNTPTLAERLRQCERAIEEAAKRGDEMRVVLLEGQRNHLTMLVFTLGPETRMGAANG